MNSEQLVIDQLTYFLLQRIMDQNKFDSTQKCLFFAINPFANPSKLLMSLLIPNVLRVAFVASVMRGQEKLMLMKTGTKFCRTRKSDEEMEMTVLS